MLQSENSRTISSEPVKRFVRSFFTRYALPTNLRLPSRSGSVNALKRNWNRGIGNLDTNGSDFPRESNSSSRRFLKLRPPFENRSPRNYTPSLKRSSKKRAVAKHASNVVFRKSPKSSRPKADGTSDRLLTSKNNSRKPGKRH